MSYEIFRVGTRTDANSNTVTITHADLAAAVQAYDPKVHEAPIVVATRRRTRRLTAGSAD